MTQQDLQENLQNLEAGAPVEKTLSVIELIFSGGTAGVFIIGILFVLLVVGVYIYFERLFFSFTKLS